MEIISHDSAPVGREELRIFDTLPTQISVQNTKLVPFHPVTSIEQNSDGPFEYCVYSNHEMIDLNSIYTFMEFNVTGSDGADLDFDDTNILVSLINNYGKCWLR